MAEGATIVAIAGGVLTSGITGFVTWRVSHRSSAVELAKIEAEADRLQQGNREEERRNRQSTYHQYINAVLVVYQLMGREASSSEVNDARDTYRYLHAGVILFGPPSVAKGAYAVAEAYSQISPALKKERDENPEKPDSECWRDVTRALQDDFGAKIVETTALMHADVTRDIADDPSSDL